MPLFVTLLHYEDKWGNFFLVSRPKNNYAFAEQLVSFYLLNLEKSLNSTLVFPLPAGANYTACLCTVSGFENISIRKERPEALR